MSPRTLTRPPEDPGMWRKLLARTHPDTGGDHDLFIWCAHLRRLVCGGDSDRGGRSYATGSERTGGEGNTTEAEPERIPFEWAEDFDALTMRAMTLSREAGEPHAALLRVLADCEAAHVGTPLLQQQRGATYKQAAAIAHRAGMSKEERRGWYRVCEDLPLSQRHADHILSRLAEEGQAA